MQDTPITGGGAGRALPKPILFASAACALFATAYSLYSIDQQLRAYRKPILQRYVVRLLLMVPIYSLASMASLFSLQAAFVIDVIRDVYEGFVIWSFFSLLVEYLGGERSLLILVHGRRPIPHPFPVNILFRPLDISDPYTFLALKRGILQYVQIKPILAVVTVILKSFGKYDDGQLAWNNGYTWISITYNISVFLSLYCLGMFWAGMSDDLAPFRVTSKFICIKGIIFFSFWQGFGVSILVAAGLIRQIGPVRDEEYISLAVQDMLICLEMPLFALGHAYAFSPRDYVDPFSSFQSRLPVYYALRDAIGMYDVISDSLTTIRGTGYAYQTFEPSEGVIHQGLGRERRVRAGLRYTQGGKAKYWLPLRGSPEVVREGINPRHLGPARQFRRWLDKKRMEREGYAPLLPQEVQDAVHDDVEAAHDPLGVRADDEEDGQGLSQAASTSSLIDRARQWAAEHANASLDYLEGLGGDEEDTEDADHLAFPDVHSDDEEERLYEKSRALSHGDYAFPSVDIRQEEARRQRWEDDENLLQRYRAQKGQRRRVSRILGQRSEDKDQEREENAQVPQAAARPPGVVDLLVEDSQAEERERLRERRRGDPALRAGQRTRIFRREWEPEQRPEFEPEEEPSPKRRKDNPAKGSNHQRRSPRIRRSKHTERRIENDAFRSQHPEAHNATGALRQESEHHQGAPRANETRPVESANEPPDVVSETVDPPSPQAQD